MISIELSKKLKSVSGLLTLFVLGIHAWNLSIVFDSVEDDSFRVLNFFIQNFLSNGIFRIAVPLFFIISGYLFFLNYTTFSFQYFLDKYKSRLNSILLPYLLWSCISLFIYLFLENLPYSKPFFNKEPVSDSSLQQFFHIIFFDSLGRQLWYLRDLFVLVLLSPLLLLMIKWTRGLVLLLFLGLWINDYFYYFFSSEGLLFFSLGASLALFKINMEKQWSVHLVLASLFLWVGMVAWKTWDWYNMGEPNPIVHKLGILVGIVAFWFWFDDFNFSLKRISEFSFFIYLGHEPLLTVFNKGLAYLFQKPLLSYIIAPLMVLLIVLGIGLLLKTKQPKLYSALIGNR